MSRQRFSVDTNILIELSAGGRPLPETNHQQRLASQRTSHPHIR